MNKNLFTYSIIILLIIPIFGINFVLNLIGNIFLLILLIPILLFIIATLALSGFKRKSQICTNCGLTSFGNNDTCLYCGSSLVDNQIKKDIKSTPQDKIIEIEAEEIK